MPSEKKSKFDHLLPITDEPEPEPDRTSRRHDPEYHQTSLLVPHKLWQRFKIVCIRREVRMYDIVAELVGKWLEENDPNGA